MISIALSLAAIPPPAATGPMLPVETGPAVFEYAGCLFDPLTRSHEVPVSLAEREAMVGSIIGQCRETRERAARETEAILRANTRFADPAERRATIENMFARWEQQLRFMIVERERFIETSQAYEACLDGGDFERC